MEKATKYPRLLDSDITPTSKDIKQAVGTKVLPHWEMLREFLKANYEFEPELTFYGKKYGWSFKYRRKGKTLCVLFPEHESFTVLVTLGKKEIALVDENLDGFGKTIIEIYQNARQYHDGKWIFKRVLSKKDLADVIKLITIKKKPKKK